MMKKIVAFIIPFLLSFSIGTVAEEFRFERIKSYDIEADRDQNHLLNFFVVGDYLFYINYFYSADLFSGVMRIWAIDTVHDMRKIIVWISNTYDGGIPTTPLCTGEIYYIDGIVYFPDTQNFSYQCSPEGDYIGKFPNFQAPSLNDSLAKGIVLGGKPIQFPVTLGNRIYSDRFVTEKYLIFIGDDHYLLVDREELAVNGEDIVKRKLVPFPADRVADVSFIPTDCDRSYIVYETQSEYKISLLRITDSITDCSLESIAIGKPSDSPSHSFLPDHSSGSRTRFSGCDGYRPVYNGMYYQLLKYRIVGLEGVSAVKIGDWEFYK